MRKRMRYISVLLILAGLTACGSVEKAPVNTDSNAKTDIGKETGDEYMNDNTDTIVSEDDISKFASGIADDGNASDDKIQPENDLVIDGSIYEKCPAKAIMRQPGIKYGTFAHETYFSGTCGMERGFNILLPADYDPAKKYPVLYLLHGIFGDEYSMTDSANKVIEMTSYLAAIGVMEETVVVCPNMFARDNLEIQPGFTAEQCVPYDNFINDLVNDLMPYIEDHYSVKTGRENTLLAGFSMGGRETLYIALKRPELFGYVCAIAPAPGVTPGKDNFMTHPGQMSEEEFKFEDGAIVPDVFIVTAGDRDSVVGKFPKGYHELFDKNGVSHIWYEIEGADHDSNAIKSGLFNLFIQTAYAKANH